MKATALLASALLFAAKHVGAKPLEKRDASEVTTALQFALTLEHLENTFYTQALNKFDAAAFEKAGFPSWVRGRFVQIGQHEATHVQFLTSALGSAAPAACTYNFPYNDPKSFAALSYVLETVGNSAYLGGAGLLTSNPAVLEAAASILSVEGRHSGWIESAVFKSYPWSGPFDTPLTPRAVLTLASSFIKSCPSTNPTLPFVGFPSLSASPAAAQPGQQITLTYNSTGSSTEYAAFLTGLSTKFAKIEGNKVTIPKGLQGISYLIISSNGTAVSDDSTVAGPVVFSFPFDSYASNAGN